MADKIRVLVVDDSALVRQLVSQILASDPGIEVVATAPDPYVARDKIMELKPDVMTLDVEMPRMDGLTFLEKVMKGRPMPVVMCSSLTEAGCAETLRALELGAVDYIAKPKSDVRDLLPQLRAEVISKVKAAAGARMSRVGAPRTPAKPIAATAALRIGATERVICVGASTGGTEALKEFLTAFPAEAPSVVVVQHMPEKFTQAFAGRLNEVCQVRVKEAQDRDRCLPGRVLIAPGAFHMKVVKDGAGCIVRIVDEPPINHHKPSVDVMFDSCAQALGARAVGVIMTGMGDDGANGMLRMRQAGARTLAQAEASCVVFGMPKVAIERGGVEQVLPLDQLAGRALELAAQPLSALAG
ncbi:MAG: chemotaxis response regulator protein-glutamate methylesterase [Planctomycetes bacterium]|nr:chemotaxis response regulator protein-glutamate methylesterase [Planctomycetota bacterium]